MWWGAHEGIGWWMVFGGIWMAIFWGAIIGLVVWGVRWMSYSNTKSDETDDPLEIARRRYARGEITKEQFEDMSAILE